MDWQPEIVYAVLGAVVTGVLGWIVRGLRVKPQMKALERKIESGRKEVAALREQMATPSKADSMLKAAQAAKTREEVLKMQEEQRERTWLRRMGF